MFTKSMQFHKNSCPSCVKHLKQLLLVVMQGIRPDKTHVYSL